MIRAVSLFVLLSALGQQLLVAPQNCNPNADRSDCGHLGTTQDQCLSSGCCWSPKDNEPWCFKENGQPSSVCKTDGARRDCGKVGTTQSSCEAKGCCWDPKPGSPYCFFKTTSYTVQSVTTTKLGAQVMLKAPDADSSSDVISPVMMEVTQETSQRLHVKFYDPKNKRWEVPSSILPVPDPPSAAPGNQLYNYDFPEEGRDFFFSVSRKDTRETLFNTSTVGPLHFRDQFLSIGTVLPPNYNIYGLGEHKTPLRLKQQIYTLWNYDTATPPDVNLYGSHPFYLDHRPNGTAHGVFLRNSNGMDVVLGEGMLTFNVIGGVLDFYFFLGPTPEAVVQQYQEVIGRPHMPPYWSLGFHQCRYGYHDIQEVEDVVDNYAKHKIPLDTMWTDIDYMQNYKDFTVDSKNYPQDQMQKFISKLHSNGQHYVVIIDPGINVASGYKPYEDGIKEDIFIKDKNGKVFQGKVWPGYTAFPDFFNSKAADYWKSQIAAFLKIAPVDGLWIDMNEVSNFCNGACVSSLELNFTHQNFSSSYKLLRGRRDDVGFDPNNPPYHINSQNSKTALNIKTIDMDAKHAGGLVEYNVHNLFGFMEAIATRAALESLRSNVRSFVLSRSTFPGSGVHTGHWTGDNAANEGDLYFSIPGMLNFQMFGIPLIGSDICGFIGDTSEELCSRWMELGAFYPFSRNHNTKGASSQEPYVWDSVAQISRNVLAIRYFLLPYYYTLFYKAHRKVDSANPPSATVVRPLFFEFPKDSKTYAIDTQFMVGSGILISPQLKLGGDGKSLSVYFPQGVWYDWYTHQIASHSGQETKTVDTPVDHIPIHIRGGSVIPMQGPALTTKASRANNYTLLVALDTAGSAHGDLFLDDGVSIDIKDYTFVDYQVKSNSLSNTVSGTEYASKSKLPPLGQIVILGVQNKPSSVKLNGNGLSSFQYDDSTKTLTVYVIKLQLMMDAKLDLQY